MSSTIMIQGFRYRYGCTSQHICSMKRGQIKAFKRCNYAVVAWSYCKKLTAEHKKVAILQNCVFWDQTIVHIHKAGELISTTLSPTLHNSKTCCWGCLNTQVCNVVTGTMYSSQVSGCALASQIRAPGAQFSSHEVTSLTGQCQRSATV